MRKILLKESYALTEENIDRISDEIGNALSPYSTVSRKDILKHRLSAEEILMQWIGTAKNLYVELLIETNNKEVNISMSLDGITYKRNPLAVDGYDESNLVGNMLGSLGVGWLFQYDRGRNVVYTSIGVKEGNLFRSLAIIIIGAIVTTVLLRLSPAIVRNFFDTYVLDLLFNYGCNFLKMIVTPMMFLSVIAGVMSMGSPRYLQADGQHIIKRFMGSTLCMILATGVLCAFLFPIELDFSLETGVKPILSFLETLVPTNILSPFIEGSLIQVIFLGVIVGIAMLYLQRRVHTISRLVEEGNALVFKIINGFEVFLDAFVYLSMVDVGLAVSAHQLLQFIKFMAIYAIFIILATFVRVVISARIIHMPTREIWKRLKDNALLQLSVATTYVVYSGARDDCEEKFGVDNQLLSVGLPIGTIIHKPIVAAELIVMLLGVEYFSGSTMSISNLILVCFLAFVVSMAYPPMGGGEIAGYTILLTQLGLPMGYLSFVCSMSSLMDLLEAPCNTLMTELGIIETSEKLKKQRKKQAA